MRSKVPGVVVGILLVLIVASPARADFALRDWRFLQPLELPPEAAPDQPVELIIDEDVFAFSNARLSDLRIVDDLGSETGYLLETLRGQVERSAHSLQVLDQGYDPGNYSYLTVDFGPTTIKHNQLILDTPSQPEFWRSVEIEESTDNQSWSLIDTDEIYRVVKGSSLAQSQTLNYPPSSARYLRIKIDDDGSDDLQMGGAIGYLDQSVAPTLMISRQPVSARLEDASTKTSIFDVDRGRSGVPFHRVTLESPSSNFIRSVTVQVGNDGEHWRTAVSTEIFAYTVGTNPVGDLEISVPESTDRYLRIIVFNEDNPPIEITAVVLEGHAKRLVFLADPARTYALYYGKDGSSTPVYDTARVLSRTSTFNLPEVTAGSHRDNPGYAAPVPPPPPVVPFTERLPWLIPAVVVLAALAVGALLLSILRKAKSLTAPPE